MQWNVKYGKPLWHRAHLFLGWVRMTDCESVWNAVMMLSVALLSATAQPAVHASLRISSYPVSEHTTVNHDQNGNLCSNYHSSLDFIIEGPLAAFLILFCPETAMQILLLSCLFLHVVWGITVWPTEEISTVTKSVLKALSAHPGSSYKHQGEVWASSAHKTTFLEWFLIWSLNF